MILFIFYLLTQTTAKIPDEFACEALPMVYGPTCEAPVGIEGWSNSLIIYKIKEIVSSTSIECYGRGVSNLIQCNGGVMNWYPLGILKEGDQSSIFWGDNIGYPAIKCKGIPLLTGITWEYILISHPQKNCCGNKMFELSAQACCSGFVFNNPYDHYCCSGALTYPGDCCTAGDPTKVTHEIPCEWGRCCTKNKETLERICCDHKCNQHGVCSYDDP